MDGVLFDVLPSCSACALLALALACSEPEGPAPELAADVEAIRELMATDPAAEDIERVERVAIDRPVAAAGLLASSGLPAARTQAARARELALTSHEGRALGRRVSEAYEQRVQGLEQWQRYLEDAATDDTVLLAATTSMRQAEVALLRIDSSLESIVPTGRRTSGEPAPEPQGPRRPHR